MAWAGAQVEARMTSGRGMLRLRNFDMVPSMVFMPPLALLTWRSVEIVSGAKPWRMAGTAHLKSREPEPWPTSNKMPRSRALR